MLKSSLASWNNVLVQVHPKPKEGHIISFVKVVNILSQWRVYKDNAAAPEDSLIVEAMVRGDMVTDETGKKR
jgi:hypothetical protein